MQSLRDVQRAFYAPKQGPPILLYHEPNPLRNRQRKRRKLSKKYCGIPPRPKDVPSSNLLGTQLPDGFPPELAFRALAAYSLLRTLSRELRLSPFTPNVFLRALYLPLPNRLLGQTHASLLRILLASLNMGYSCRPKGNNIPDVVRKKRRVDGVRWPLRAGDNLTFLDNFSWPLFYDDYVHLTADILWATLNDEENYADFRNIGMPDVTGMIMEEDLIEQEQEESLMARPVKMLNSLMGMNTELNPYAMDPLSRSSRSARRSQIMYVHVESDDDSYEDEPIEEVQVEEDEDFMGRSKKKQGKKRSLPKTPKKASHSKLPVSTNKKSTSNSKSSQAFEEKKLGMVGTHGLHPGLKSNKEGQTPTGTANAKKSIRKLPFSRPPKNNPSTSTSPEEKNRSPTLARKLPTHKGGSPSRKLPTQKSGSPPKKKAKRSPFSGSKVEWVEEGPSLIVGNGSTTIGLGSHVPIPNVSPSIDHKLRPLKKVPAGIVQNAADPVPTASASPVDLPNFDQNSAKTGPKFFNTEQTMGHIAQGRKAVTAQFGASSTTAELKKTTAHTPSANYHHRNLGMRLPSSSKSKSAGGRAVSMEVSSAVHDFISGNLCHKQERYRDSTTVTIVTKQECQPLGSADSTRKSGPLVDMEESLILLSGNTTNEPQMVNGKEVNYPNGTKSEETITTAETKGNVEDEELHLSATPPGSTQPTTNPQFSDGHGMISESTEHSANPEARSSSGSEPNVDEPSHMNETEVDEVGLDITSRGEQGSIGMVHAVEAGEASPQSTSKVVGSFSQELYQASSSQTLTVSNFLNNLGCGTMDVEINKVPENLQAPDLQTMQGQNGTASAQRNLGDPKLNQKVAETAPGSSVMGKDSSQDTANTQSNLAQTLPMSKQLQHEHSSTATPSAYNMDSLKSESQTSRSFPSMVLSATPMEGGQGFAIPAVLQSPGDALKSKDPRQEAVIKEEDPPADIQNLQSNLKKKEQVSTVAFDGVTAHSSDSNHGNQSAESMDVDNLLSQCFDNEPLHFADDEDQWPQFQPIKSMREGIPYHRLELEEKLAIIEFLIDELLSMGTFASVFTERHSSNMFGPNYGALPSKREFDELENEDECAVCRGEGELLCCDGCTSSYHRPCIDMKPNEILPEGRWLCPECELVDPAMYGPLHGGRKSSLDWFTVDDINIAISLKKASEQNALMASNAMGGMAPWDQTSNPNILLQQLQQAGIQLGDLAKNPNVLLQLQQASIQMGGPNLSLLSQIVVNNFNSGLIGRHGVYSEQLGMMPCSQNAVLTSLLQTQTTSLFLKSGYGPSTNALSGASTETSEARGHSATEQVSKQKWPEAHDLEYLVIHGFVFSRPRRNTSKGSNAVSTSLVPLTKSRISEVLKLIGTETCLSWPLVQIPFTVIEESDGPVSRSLVHPKMLAFETKATFDPTCYTSKYRKTPLAKSAFPGAGFHSIQLLLSDYEYACNSCNLKRLSDRLSPEMSTDSVLAQSLRAEANLFDPYQLIRDYMLKLENLLNRAHLLNEFWGTRNKRVLAHVWLSNVRGCRSIPRFARLLLYLVDACHRRTFMEQWFMVSGSKEAEHAVDDHLEKDSRALHPLPPDWSLAAEKRRRMWERSSLANVLPLLTKENLDVERWVYGNGNSTVLERGRARRKRKQTVTGRSPYSPSRIMVSSKDSKKFSVDEELSLGNASLGNRDVASLADKDSSKKKVDDSETHAVVSVSVLHQAIDRRVNTGIPSDEQEKPETQADEENGSNEVASAAAKSRRSRRSGRLQTKKESPEDFIANVIAESGKSQKDLSMDTLIEAQKMSKLVEIKEVSATAYVNTTHWPVAGRLLFDPVGSVPPSEMRRLGRNAGTVMAQSVSYTGSYEVGVVSDFHIWRKNIQKCFSYEQLLLLIRSLESNLDRSTIASCESLARRTPSVKNQVAKAILCTQKDALTGVDYYFVYQKNKNRGSWFSAQTVELSPFMIERSERREKRLNEFNIKVREKAIVEERAREAARAQAAAEAAARTQALMREQAEAKAKAAREQAEARARALKEKTEVKAAAKAAKIAAKKKEKAEKAAAKAKLKAEKDAAKEAAMAAKIRQAALVTQIAQAPQVVEMGNATSVAQVLAAHKVATQRLIRESSQAGLSYVPEAEMKKLRLEAATELTKCYGTGQIDSNLLFSQLGRAESEALRAETEVKKAAVDSRLRSMGGQSSRQSSRPSRPPETWSQATQGTAVSPQPHQAIQHSNYASQRPSSSMYAMQNPLHNQSRPHQQNANHSSTNSAMAAVSNAPGPAGFTAYGGSTVSSQYKPHTEGYSQNPTGAFQRQSKRGTPQQVQNNHSELTPGSHRGLIPGHTQNLHAFKPQSNPPRTQTWNANTALNSNNYLHSLGGEAGNQDHRGTAGINNNQLRGSSNSWDAPRTNQEGSVRDLSSLNEHQMAKLARLASERGVSVQTLLQHAKARMNGGNPSYQQAAPRRLAQNHQQASGQVPAPSIASPNNLLQGCFSGGQFNQNVRPSGVRQALAGYDGHHSYGGPSNYGQGTPGNYPPQQSQQAFDFEPTPIAEMAPRAPHDHPQPSRNYNSVQYQQLQQFQQQQLQQQQHSQHHQWFQR